MEIRIFAWYFFNKVWICQFGVCLAFPSKLVTNASWGLGGVEEEAMTTGMPLSTGPGASEYRNKCSCFCRTMLWLTYFQFMALSEDSGTATRSFRSVAERATTAEIRTETVKSFIAKWPLSLDRRIYIRNCITCRWKMTFNWLSRFHYCYIYVWLEMCIVYVCKKCIPWTI